MSAKHQKVEIEIPAEYGPTVREAIARDVVEFIRKRSDQGLDRNNRPFAKYSKAYIESLDFKIAGKSKGSVDLKLSGDMLGALDMLNHKRGKITVGFERGSEENARADGNIRGTYGQQSQTSAKRDFLGIAKKDLKGILDKYPVEDLKTARTRAKQKLEAQSEVRRVEVETEDD